MRFPFVFFLTAEIFQRKAAAQKGLTELTLSLAGNTGVLGTIPAVNLVAGAETLRQLARADTAALCCRLRYT